MGPVAIGWVLFWLCLDHPVLIMPAAIRPMKHMFFTTCTSSVKENIDVENATTKPITHPANSSTELKAGLVDPIATSTTIPSTPGDGVKVFTLFHVWSNSTHTMLKRTNGENDTGADLFSKSYFYPGMHITTAIPRFRMNFLDLLLQDYDQRAWPTYGTDAPTHVKVNIYINTLGAISAENMEYTLDIFLRQEWLDPRLSLSRFNMKTPLRLNGGYIVGRIWKPDLFFRNVKQANFHAITEPNMMISLGPEGEVLYSSRITLKLSCPMSLRNYPLDRQRCHLIMGSYSYTSDIVQLQWMEPAITFDHKMEIPDYYLEGISLGSAYDRHFIVIGDYSFLNVSFLLDRQNGYHLVQTYLPTLLIVMISWVSFWLNVDASPARTTLGVTTLLALTTVAAGIRRQLPPVSYIKAVDIWIGACSIMVFGAFLEFALVNYLSRSKLRPAQFRHSMNVFHFTSKEESDRKQALGEDARLEIARNLKRAKNVDRTCRIVFPTVFFAFNVLYWIYYLHFSRKN